MRRADRADHDAVGADEAEPLDEPAARVRRRRAAGAGAARARGRSSTSHVTHLYGLTETYGPLAVCAWNPDWDDLPDDGAGQAARAPGRRHGRQPSGCAWSTRTCSDVPADGETLGEVVHARRQRDDRLLPTTRRRPREAFKGGWFHSGDLGVMHPDGYVELRDRLKDVIISGGENIATIEVEQALSAHPVGGRGGGRRRAATSAGARCPSRSSPRPAATSPTPRSCSDFARERLARFKVPEADRRRRRAAQDRHRQDPEVRAAREGRRAGQGGRQGLVGRMVRRHERHGGGPDGPWGQRRPRRGGAARRGSAPAARRGALHRRSQRARRGVGAVRALRLGARPRRLDRHVRRRRRRRAWSASTPPPTSASATLAHGNVPEAMARPVLATDRVRFAGEAVAIVVAESRAQAVDAAELVVIDYEPLDVLIDMTERARGRRAAAVRARRQRGRRGRRRAEEDVLADADVVVARALRQPARRRRAAGARRRARGARPGDRRRHPVDAGQGPHSVRGRGRRRARAREAAAAGRHDVDGRRLRRAHRDVPGADRARRARARARPRRCATSRRARRRWSTMQHGRAQVQDVELGGKRDGTLTGLQACG